MGDSWDRTIFDKELKSILDAKLPVSASKITALQTLAISHPEHHNYIVHCILRFIETAPPDYRLAGLYVVDAISRAVQKQIRKQAETGENKPVEAEGYLRRFSIVLRDDALLGCFAPCSSKDKEKVKRTLDIWEQGGVYSRDLVEYIKQSFMEVAGASNVSKGDGRNKPHEHVPATNVETEQTSKALAPAVDTATLLATLTSLSKGNLANLANVLQTSTSTTTSDGAATALANASNREQGSKDNDAALPPALAKLLGGIASTTGSSSNQAVPVPPASVPSSGPSFGSTSQQQSVPYPRPPAPTETPARPSFGQTFPSDPRLRMQPSLKNTPGPRPYQPPPTVPAGLPPAAGMPPRNAPFPPANPPMVPPQSGRSRPSRWDSDERKSHNRLHRDEARADSGPGHRESQGSMVRPPSAGPPLAGPIFDPTLPPGTIRVLTRTLFVGPLPDSCTKNDLIKIFSKYGELNSVILSRRSPGRPNAFLKYKTRSAIEAAKNNTGNLVMQNISVKVNWAYGFGPKKLFNYDVGESIIPLHELTEDEKASLVTAPIGGFQGQPVRDQMTIEEPEVQYRPEWKKEELQQSRMARSKAAQSADDHVGRKRRRFDGPDEEQRPGPQPQPQPQPQQPPPNRWGNAPPPFPPEQRPPMPPPPGMFNADPRLQQQQQQWAPQPGTPTVARPPPFPNFPMNFGAGNAAGSAPPFHHPYPNNYQ